MAHQVMAFTSNPEFDLWDPDDGKREPTSTNRPLISMHILYCSPKINKYSFKTKQTNKKTHNFFKVRYNDSHLPFRHSETDARGLV